MLCLVNLFASPFLFAQERYLIQAEIAGAKKEHTYAYLALVKKDTNELIDSVEVVKGKFTFTGKVAEPNVYSIRVENLPGTVLLVLENTTITLKAEATAMSNARISGSVLTDERTAYQEKHVTPAREEMAKNDKLASAFLLKGDSLQAIAYEQKNKYIRLRQNVIAEQYLKAHPQSFQSLALLDTLWRIVGYQNTEGYLQALPLFLQKHSIAKRIRAEKQAQIKLEEATSIGVVAPVFTQPDTSNTLVSLNSFRGKHVLVDFWASWCGPCREEHPELVKLYEKYRADGFEIVSVSLDEEKEKWLQAIQKDQLPWTHVSDLKGSKNQAAALYGVKAIPNRYLLDREGKIIAKVYGAWGLEGQLKKLFPKPNK
jgi:peroxiredoxin